MKNATFIAAICLLSLPILSPAQSKGGATEKSADAKAQAQVEKAKVEKWGEATLIMKDEKGNVVLTKTEKYPISKPIQTTVAADVNNCWEYCRRVCDGYGVCWVSCGWHCSPWTK